MFFKHKHLLKDLREHGREGNAEILSMRTIGEGGNMRSAWSSDEDLTTTWFDCWMKLLVQPVDRSQPPFEATVKSRVHTLKWQGSHVPVWYDPEDHSRVVVDYEADVENKIHLAAHSDLLMHRHDSRLGLAWTPLSGELVPVEVTAATGKGRLTVPRKWSALLEEPAQAAFAYVRANTARLLPELDASWFTKNDVQVVQAYGNVPVGATVADGHAAGAAVVAALVSYLGGHLVRPEVAVTGAVTATGELVPIEGFGEALDAAKHSYATVLVAPAGNQAEATKIGQRRRQGVELVFAGQVDEALHKALARRALKAR
ncbi:S16 family serine protease [Streptacidiphilus sp. MAP5-3]|uniref:S16 family serine protease n=1 Tax=unclassified Streptacidiphilus TaxID=2643834 RepID=UPI0035170023